MKLKYKAQDITGADVKTKDFKKQANNELENEKWVSDKTIRTQIFKFEVDANYTLGINYTDLAGNTAVEYKTHYFTVDTKSPEGTVVMSDGNGKTAGEIYSKNLRILFLNFF